VPFLHEWPSFGSRFLTGTSPVVIRANLFLKRRALFSPPLRLGE